MIIERHRTVLTSIVVGLVCALITGITLKINETKQKYKMNLKCVQGELYEEIRPNFYVKSHLECIEQRSF